MIQCSIGRSVPSILVRIYDACMPHSCYYILYFSPVAPYNRYLILVRCVYLPYFGISQVATESDLGLADAYINGWCSFPDEKEGLLNLFLVKLYH
jgi:hypothetical protein